MYSLHNIAMLLIMLINSYNSCATCFDFYLETLIIKQLQLPLHCTIYSGKYNVSRKRPYVSVTAENVNSLKQLFPQANICECHRLK